jgi:cell division protease FtsH
MTRALLEWETLDSDQLNDIMAGKPPRPPKVPAAGNTPSAPTDGAQGAAAPAASTTT